ncbi:MAG: glycosyltransferase family 2 protein [Lachnospiraceae bacterium]|jgi:glycosyltransferase involved in cell wall biosynthesis|nr:glycosyltransferase family 2 protein [Lachnospiraceae bacterium]
MKLLTVVIPCHNAGKYLTRAVDSALGSSKEVEIIIIDSESKDGSSKVADDYCFLHPSIVRVIHKENMGTGDAINAALRMAEGIYFKVLEPTDILNKDALRQVINLLKTLKETYNETDMLITNYVVERVDSSDKKTIHYRSILPQGKVFSWKQTGRFKVGQYMPMHSVIYRTGLLRLSQMELPKYSIYYWYAYLFHPLPFIRKLYYLDADLLRHYQKKEEEAGTPDTAMAIADQRVFISREIMTMYKIRKVPGRKLRNYMANMLAVIMAGSTVLLNSMHTKDSRERKREIWHYLRRQDFGLYLKIRYGILGQGANFPGLPGRNMTNFFYRSVKQLLGYD